MSPNRLPALVASLTPAERAQYRRWLDRRAFEGWGLRVDAEKPASLRQTARAFGVAPKRGRAVERGR